MSPHASVVYPLQLQSYLSSLNPANPQYEFRRPLSVMVKPSSVRMPMSASVPLGVPTVESAMSLATVVPGEPSVIDHVPSPVVDETPPSSLIEDELEVKHEQSEESSSTDSESENTGPLVLPKVKSRRRRPRTIPKKVVEPKEIIVVTPVKGITIPPKSVLEVRVRANITAENLKTYVGKDMLLETQPFDDA